MNRPNRKRLHNKIQKRYEVSLETRKFEIDLFWRRSIFFWGFIAAAFIAYASYSGDKTYNPYLRIIISFFGFACSFCWTLVNRGSKYWQENWEHQVDIIEDKVTGPLFKIPAAIDTTKNWWLRARKYSVSKITIALSDYVVLVWAGMTFYSIINLSSVSQYLEGKCKILYLDKEQYILMFSGITILWMILVLIFGQTTEKDMNKY